MILLEQYALHSPLRDKSPAAKTIFSFGSLFCCLLLGSPPLWLLVVVCAGWMAVRRAGAPLRVFLRLFAAPLGFVLLGVLPVAIRVSNVPCVFPALALGGRWFYLSEESAWAAMRLLLRAAAGISCLCFSYLSTPVSQFLGLLSRWKAPSLLVELSMLLYRFIFVLLEQTARITTAQKSRLGYQKIPLAFRSVGLLGGAAFLKAFWHADAVFSAMQARGYDGKTTYLGKTLPCPGRTKRLLAGYFMLLLLVGRIGGWG